MSVQDEDNKAFEAIQAEKAELGIADEPKEDESEKSDEARDAEKKESEKEEVDEDESEEEEAEESDESDEKEEEEDSKEDAKDDADKDDEETEEADESDEDKDDSPKAISPKAYKNLKRELQADFDKKLKEAEEKYKGKDAAKDASKVSDEDINTLAKELNFDPEKTKKIIEISRKGLEATEEDKAFIKEQREFFEAKKADDFQKEQAAIFNGEWGAVLPQVKTMFPNASDEQIAKVKAEVDKLSHTKKYHQTDLDYILFKEKASFEKIAFSPKSKTFESGKPQVKTEDDFDGSAPENLNDMSPAQFAEFEKKREAYLSESPKQKLTIKTRDDRGRATEREE